MPAAGELGADLLVVGGGGPRRTRRAVAATTRRTAIGKVADASVRSAPCPVLVVRGAPGGEIESDREEGER